jgi:hypothetical protein
VTPPVVTPPVVTPPVIAPPSTVSGALMAPPISTPPITIGAVPGLALAVIGGGVRMPPVQVATATEDERPVRRAGTAPGPNAFLPVKPAPAKPIVPVHPRKQARH